MFLDPKTNFARTTLSVGITSIATVMTPTSISAFPDPDVDGDFNVVIWNQTDYPLAYDDPNKEIVRVTSETAGVYTITRAQEGTSASAHNTVGKTYGVMLTYTKKDQDDIEAFLQGKTGTAIASATTTDIGASTGQNVHITGTTTITGLGTVNAGTFRRVEFDGALTLTHNATSLILPGSANITTAAGDVAYFVSLGSGNWKCEAYNKKNGEAVVAAGGGGWSNLGTTTLGSAATTMTLSSFTAKERLKVYAHIEGVSAAANAFVRFNSDTGSNYADRIISNGGAAASNNAQTRQQINNGAIQTNEVYDVVIDIFNKGTERKTSVLNGSTHTTASVSIIATQQGAGLWDNTADQITTISVDLGGSTTLGVGSYIEVFGMD